MSDHAELMMSALLTLVRHGQTTANLEGVWDGSIDAPLTELGLRQAERVAAFLADYGQDATAVYSSPLQRALRTAERIAAGLGLAVRVEAGLSEYHLGEWEGKTYTELQHEHRLWHFMSIDPDYAPHGGESPRQVSERFTGALRCIADAHPGERVIVVAHAGALSMALGALLDGDYTRWRRVMENCAVSELRLDPVPELLTFNLTDHLEGI